MTPRTELDLMRLLHGELPEEQARALRDRLEREPEQAAAFARLQGTWEGLDLPPASPPPPGFAGRITARVRAHRAQAAGLSWSAAPAWVRAAAAAALMAGTALGVGVGGRLPAAGVEGTQTTARTATTTVTPATEAAMPPAATPEAIPQAPPRTVSAAPETVEEDFAPDLSLAGSYWDAVEGLDDESGAAADGETRP